MCTTFWLEHLVERDNLRSGMHWQIILNLGERSWNGWG